MKYLKKLCISLVISILSIIVLTFIMTLLNYFDIVGTKIMNISKVIIPLLSLALGGFYIGKNSLKNGYLEGLKLGSIITLFILIGNLIFSEITFKDVIFYILLIISAIFGGMAGINRVKEKD